MGEFVGTYIPSLRSGNARRLAALGGRHAFAGVACLYGANRVGCMYSAKRFPSAGVGVQYVLKPAHGIVANMELAFGKEDDKAFLFKMGYAS